MPDSPERGRLIMFDGPDGVGKSTQLEFAAWSLAWQGLPVYATRLNGGTEFGEAGREVLIDKDLPRIATAELYLAMSIYANLADDLAQRRAAGVHCLVDRSPLSIIAYQVFGAGLPSVTGKKAARESLNEFDPDLILIYHATAEKLRANKNEVPTEERDDYFENQSIEYKAKVAYGYRRAHRMFRQLATAEVDANPDAIPVYHETMQHIWRVLQPTL